MEKEITDVILKQNELLLLQVKHAHTLKSALHTQSAVQRKSIVTKIQSMGSKGKILVFVYSCIAHLNTVCNNWAIQIFK